ncbi:hypothetical protein Trydic_g9556 [Trypoxylus dichotomus]
MKSTNVRTRTIRKTIDIDKRPNGTNKRGTYHQDGNRYLQIDKHKRRRKQQIPNVRIQRDNSTGPVFDGSAGHLYVRSSSFLELTELFLVSP